MWRTVWRNKYLLLLLFLSFNAIVARGLWNASRDPIVRRATLLLDDWPADAPPMRILFLSDTHVAGPNMPPERLTGILTTLSNQLQPDIILAAGDFHSGMDFATRHYSPRQQTQPFASASAPLGIVAVMGNHDHWANARAIARGLRAAGVTLLDNQAVRRGPLIIGGLDDMVTHHARVRDTLREMDALGEGPRILLSHSPDIIPSLPRRFDLIVAGHTHCGQVRFAGIGGIYYSSRFGDRFDCGLKVDNGQRLVVTAGIGTSILPIRFGAPSDVWLLTLGRRGGG